MKFAILLLFFVLLGFALAKREMDADMDEGFYSRSTRTSAGCRKKGTPCGWTSDCCKGLDCSGYPVDGVMKRICH